MSSAAHPAAYKKFKAAFSNKTTHLPAKVQEQFQQGRTALFKVWMDCGGDFDTTAEAVLRRLVTRITKSNFVQGWRKRHQRP